MPRASIRLQHILTIPFVVVISIAVLVSGYLTWQLSEKSTLDLGHQLNQQSAVLVQERLSRFLDNAKVSNNVVKQIVSEDLEHANDQNLLLEYLQYTVKNNEKIGTVGMGFGDGTYMGIGLSPSGTLQKKIASPETGRIFYTYELPQMKEVYQRPDYDARVRPWYKEALASSKPVWSSVYEMFSSKKLGITLSEALYDKNSNFFGVVGTDIVFKDLGEQLREMRVTENTYIFVLDKEQHLIAHSDVNAEPISKLIKVKESDNELLRNSLLYINKYKTTSKDFFGTADLTVNGVQEEYFVNYVPFGHEQGLNWYIGVVIPDKDFLENVNSIKVSTLVVWLASFILSLIVGVLITFYINRSIKQLQEKVTNLNHDNAQLHDVVHHIKEVDDLSIEFSKMSKRLQDTFLEVKQSNEMLEDTVAERTKELKSVNLELMRLSKTDKLTQLANRHSFDELLKGNWERLKNGEIHHLSFIMCDIDCFKQYNDFYGHLKGDTCLVEVSKAIASAIRETDIAARYGGEEFAVILPNAKLENAKRAAHAIQNKLAQKRLPHEASTVEPIVTMSIGIATVDLASAKTPKELIKAADDALYRAKSQGRNCIVGN